MKLRILRASAAFVFGTTLLASFAFSQTRPAAPESPYGGVTVEEIIARVNDQVITRSDYDRFQKELDEESRQRGASMQEISAAHKDLLRNLIDRQLWLSKAKVLGITGETELINRLNEIRKQYNMETLEDLEKAAREQGVSFEDFKANIRNQIVTQQVMRDQVGRHVQFTPGEAQRYFEQHKQEYVRKETVRLSEILVAVVGGANDKASLGIAAQNDAEKLAAAKAKAAEIVVKLKNGGDFAQLARSFSDGPTAAQGGDLGEFERGNLAKVLEDATFSLKSGQFTEPIRTKQGYVVLKVVEHVTGGVPEYKDVTQQVEEGLYMSRMEPAIRDYLTKMREEAYIDIKPGYADTGASPRQTKPVYSAYVPPVPKKKVKVERTRFRQTTKSFRQKSGQAAPAEEKPEAATATPKASNAKVSKKTENAAVQKAGKREKIRFGKAPTQTLPDTPALKTEDAGAIERPVAQTPVEAEIPLESTPEAKKTRFSARAKLPKEPKAKTLEEQHQAAIAAPAADSAEVADRLTQTAPLGLAGDTATKKKAKKPTATTGEKTRLSERKKDAPQEPQGDLPLAPAPKQ